MLSPPVVQDADKLRDILELLRVLLRDQNESVAEIANKTLLSEVCGWVLMQKA